MITTEHVSDLVDTLEASRHRVLEAVAAARLGAPALAHATAMRMVAAWTLAPVPRDPASHVRAAHDTARAHLARLDTHDPAQEVPGVMTAEIFGRLTRRRPGPLDTACAHHYTYTPRKVLRRVMDHALDHLNQIDQWRAWHARGIVPVPTDGWAPSTVTLPEDRLALLPADLEAWLWRVDQVMRLLAQRAASLDVGELDWAPPDGGWSLRRVLHHEACCEVMYATSLDDVLAGEAPSRYAEACRRLTASLAEAGARGDAAATVHVNLYGAVRTPAEAADEVLAAEGELLAAARP